MSQYDAPGSPGPTSATPLAQSRGAGLMVGDYELLARIGEGGMGIVHLARGPEGRQVALKMLRPHVVGDEEGRRRLAREVGTLQRVRSKWIAEFLDADPWAEIPFVATRYVDGPSLHDYIAQHGPMHGHALTWLAGCLAEGLASVHAAGVLHRDVKPSNVLLQDNTPVLIDFGLARVADDAKLTHSGWLLGTPGYLAPEILTDSEPTEASDVHSWAATVAYAGLGHAPFGRGPAMAVMDRVRRGEHDLSAIESPMREILTAALDPDPKKRPGLGRIISWLTSGHYGHTVPKTPQRKQPTVDPFADALTLATGREQLASEESDSDEVPEPDVAPPPEPVTKVMPQDRPMPPQARPEPQPWDTEWNPYAQLAPAPPKPSVGERLRRGTSVASLILLLGVATALAPIPTMLVLTVVIWLVRAGSLAATTMGERRHRRGRRWHDPVRMLLGAPWDLVRSLPGTSVLLMWAAGLGLAVGLVCYAVDIAVEPALLACGATIAASVWWGPGSTRVRRPTNRVLHPLARHLGRWAATVVITLALATGGWLLAVEQGSYLEPLPDGLIEQLSRDS